MSAPAPRLLLVAERFPPDLGGLAGSAARIAGALARGGAQVDVLAWTRACPPGALETVDAGNVHPAAQGVTLHRLGLYAHLDFSLQHSLNVLEWLARERGYQALWGHYLFPAGFLATFFARRAGLPVAVSARGNDVDRLAFPPGDFARLTWTLERADLVTAVSRDLAAKIEVLVGPGRGVEVCHNAVDLEVFAPGPPSAALREALGVEPEEAVLAFVGELRQKKGFPFLLEALVEVRRRRPACLLVVGDVRPGDQARLASFAADHPEDAARVLVTGHLADPRAVAEHLRLADLFLLPSLWEGQPNALLEAMACERLALASDAGGIPECLAHEREGFLVPRHQLHRLGEAVLELLDLPAERRAAIGAAARARVLAEHDPAGEERRLGALLGRLVQRAAGASPSTSA